MEKGQSLCKANEEMHHSVLGPFFAVLVALILLFVPIFNHLKKKKESAAKESTQGVSAPSFISPITTGGGTDRYDVFLSFRGLDTRKGFTDHLYHNLLKAGTIPIHIFRDDNNIRIGEEFGSQLLDAITRSKISIPIISENYASSKWCLRELIHIMDCKKSTSHMVMPIFYKVDPSDVRYLKGKFGKAFENRKKRFDEKDIVEGKQALEEVSYLNGWESEKIANGHEGELIKLVVKTIVEVLRNDFQLHVPKELVGLDSRVRDIMNWMNNPSANARMIGIYGMGGIGKTTLAKCIYNQLSNKFVHVSFLPDIRETMRHHSIEYLQSQLISDIQGEKVQVSRFDDGINIIKSRFKEKDVLILLDDIDHNDQLNALVGECNWFNSRSIIIVTTRNQVVLDQLQFEIDYKYELNELDEEHSLILFNRHAFRMDHSPRDFEYISHDVISTMSGLPLALKVIGSYLYGKTNRKVWTDVLKQLKKQPHRDVQRTLKISYDALDNGHKEIFLDIACFFICEKIEYATYMWDDCGFYPSQGIEELKLRCLIKIEDDGKLRMHDQLRDLGRNIVCHEQLLENRSRLWVHGEASKVLMEDKGTESIEAMCLDNGPSSQRQTYKTEHFKKLRSLRFLRLRQGVALCGDIENSQLRWLDWNAFGANQSFLKIKLHLPNLSVLLMRHCWIAEDWGGWSSIMAAKRLKVLELVGCRSLKCTPDLSAFPELEILNLQGCYQLRRIHPSIGKVKSLISLDLTNCERLRELPNEVGNLEELKELILDFTGIIEIPASIGSLKKLEILSVSDQMSFQRYSGSRHPLRDPHECCIGQPLLGKLPSSMGLGDLFCRRQAEMELDNIDSEFLDLRRIPSTIGNLSSLQCLNLNGCDELREIPNSIGNLSSLQHLHLLACDSLREIPSSIGDLQNLQLLEIRGSEIEKFPCAIGRLKKLHNLSIESLCKGEIPSEIGDLPSLQHLYLRGCANIGSLRKLPSGLTHLALTCDGPSLPQLSCLIHLEELHLSYSELLEYIPELPSRLSKLVVHSCPKVIFPEFAGLNYLVELSIQKCSSIGRLDLSQLNHLKQLLVGDCNNLVEIQCHDDLRSLEEIRVHCCKTIRRLVFPKCLKKLNVKSCVKLVEIQGPDDLESLEEIVISQCRIRRLVLPKCLKKLETESCDSLAEFQAHDDLESLEEINISGCRSIRRLILPKCLKRLKAQCCDYLVEFQFHDDLRSLEEINIAFCESIQRLVLPELQCLKKLNAYSCSNLVEIQGLERAAFLEALDISKCRSIKGLPELSCFGTLKELNINGCRHISSVESLDRFLSCRSIFIKGCKSLEKLPNLSKFANLESFQIIGSLLVTEIPGIAESRSLTEIFIAHCQSLETLPDLSGCEKLQYLTVAACDKLTHLWGLEKLDLTRLEILGCKSLETIPTLPLTHKMGGYTVDKIRF